MEYPEESREELLSQIRKMEREIGDLKKALKDHQEKEKGLLQNQEVHQSLVEYASDGIFIADGQGNYIEVNSSACKMLGYTRDELLSMNMKDLVPPEDLQTRPFRVEELKQGKTLMVERNLLHKGGYLVPLEISAKMLSDGRMQGIARDITLRKRAEKELAEAHELLSTIFENTHTLIAYLKPNFDFIRVNQAYAQADDREASFFPGKNHFDIYPNEENQAIFQQVVDTKTPYFAFARPFEYTSTPGRGISYWDWNLVAIQNEHNQVEGLILTMLNVTRRIQFEEEKRTMEKQLVHAQKMEAIGRLAGGISHDFSNILTVILGYCNLIQTRFAEESKPFAKSLHAISEAGRKASALTQQLLAFSRKQFLQPQIVNLNTLVRQMEILFSRLISEDIELEVTLDQSLNLVKIDRGQIEQVLLNLVINGQDSMPQGGTLTISTQKVIKDEKRREGFSKKEPPSSGDYACLSVQDSGEGIQPDHLPHIFEPFFTTKDRGKGTGFGLATAYGIIQQHQGWIEVESKLGEGSLFRVCLPLCEEEKVSLSPKKAPMVLPQGRGERILLVEDEEGVRKFTAYALRNKGYQVLEAGNSQEAWEIFHREKKKFHLLLSDLVLPDHQGIHIVERIIQSKTDLPMLLTSGYPEEKAPWSLVSKRKLPVLRKPFLLEQLFSTVQKLIQSKK